MKYLVPFSEAWLIEYHRRKQLGWPVPATSNRDLVRQRLVEQQGLCPWCGKIIDILDVSIEHIIPLAHGGSNRMANLAVAHKRCNADRGCDVDLQPVNNPVFAFISERLKRFRNGGLIS